MLHETLEAQREAILVDAGQGLARCHLQHYANEGQGPARQKLERLLDLTIGCVRERDLGPMLRHTDTIARQRFDAGFDLRELQTAFNVLEEAIWRHVVGRVPPDELAEAIGLLTTVHGAAKDKLARTWVELATRRQAPALDVGTLFKGTAGQ
jgi:hypothetical protein